MAKTPDSREIREQVAYLEPLLGTPLTAYVAGAQTAGEVARWRAGAAPPGAGRLRLGTTYRIARLFESANVASRLRAWLREVDPDAWHLCPAERIRQADDPFELADVEAAAGDRLGIKPVGHPVPRPRAHAHAH